MGPKDADEKTSVEQLTGSIMFCMVHKTFKNLCYL